MQRGSGLILKPKYATKHAQVMTRTNNNDFRALKTAIHLYATQNGRSVPAENNKKMIGK